MKKKIPISISNKKELIVLFLSVAKWSLFSVIIGSLVGIISAAYLKALHSSITIVGKIPYYFLFIPIVFAINLWIIKISKSEDESKGAEHVIEAVHKKSGRVNPYQTFMKVALSIMTVSFGGSAGKEGPSLQLGAGVVSFLEKFLHLKDIDCKRLVITGLSAAFGAAFGTPIAGAVFCVEFLFIGKIQYDAILPSIISGIIGFYIAKIANVSYFSQNIINILSLNYLVLLKVAFIGLTFGLIALLFIDFFSLVKFIAGKIKINYILKGLIGGVLLVVLTLIFKERYLGLGDDVITSALRGEKVLPFDFLLKTIFTSITLNFGGIGGEVTPIFFVGATSGSIIGNLLSVNPAFVAALGFVAVFSGTTNTLIASTILAIELFGAGIAPYATLVNAISYVITGHKSLYETQIISMIKSPSVEIETGIEVKKAIPKVKIKGRDNSPPQKAKKP